MNKEEFDHKYFHNLPKWCKSLDTKLWFIDCHQSDFPNTLIQVLKLGLNFIPSPTRKEFQKKILVPYPELDGKFPMNDSRLTSIIIKCNEFIKRKYLLKETDKNMGPCVITIRKYHELALNLLNDKTTFSLMLWYEKDIVSQYIIELKRLQYIDVEKVILPSSTQEGLPKFTGLPKVHKPTIALRPVINASNCITTNLSKLLQEVLSERLRYFDKVNPMNMHSTTQYTEILKRIPNDEIIKQLDALDIKSLYTNIPHELIYEAVNFSFDAFPFDGEFCVRKKKIYLTRYEVMTLLKKYLKYNMFVYQHNKVDQVYKQVKGIPTGGNVSPTLAMLALSYLEIRFREDHPLIFDTLKYSARYLDDIIVVITSDDYDMSIISSKIYQDIFILEQTEVTRSEKPFLDVELSIKQGNIHWKIYRKPGNAYCYPHFKSYMPYHIKTGFIYAEMVRIFERCKSVKDAEADLQLFKERLCLRGYKNRFIEKALKRKQSTSKPQEQIKHWKVIPYIEGCSNKYLLETLSYNKEEYKISLSMHKKLINYFH